MRMKSEPIRALIAVGAGGTAVVLAHDSPTLAFDIEAIADGCDDLGIEAPRDRGLWLWEGVSKDAVHAGPEGYEPGTEYVGRCRRVEPHEVESLLAMEPPEACAVCGKPAVSDYQDREDCPSCGDPRCEIQMQAGLDYIDERG